eukprot:Skav224845  [mRNA]  locus=scaffold3408:398171:400237:+ [translate_table: standard]
MHDLDLSAPFRVTDIEGYTVLTACPSGCFRPLAFALDADCVPHWCSGKVGHSHVQVLVTLPGFAAKVCVVCVHLPHSGRSHDDFVAALSSLEECVKPFALNRTPLCLLGDLNVDLCRDFGARHAALEAFLQSLGLDLYSVDPAPTWRHRRLDHVIFNQLFVNHCKRFARQPHCDWATVQTRDDVKLALGVDHCMLCHDFLAGPSVASVPRRLRRVRRDRRPCRMQLVDANLLQQRIYAFMDGSDTGPALDPHCFLSSCASVCCSRVPPLRFQDSAALKELCHSRSVTSDPGLRRQLSLEIHRLRTAERKQWKAALLRAAANGDWKARKLLQRRPGHSPGAAARGLVSRFGSHAAAAQHVKDHFDSRFQGVAAPPLSFHGLADSEPLFSEAEIVQGVRKLKANKTTGPSQVSAELLFGFLGLPYGLFVLSTMLNFILCSPESANVELASGWVYLVPKKPHVDDASQFRPIVCGEVFLKLAAGLATARLVGTWSVPRSCFGTVRGQGLPEALYILRHVSQTSAGLLDDTLFVQLDLSQAFDSLHINALLSFFFRNWSASSAKSANLLRWALLHSHLRFEIFDSVWWCSQQRGTQQGGTHSPTLFSRVVAACFDTLTDAWRARGELPAFFAGHLLLWGIWFIDDAILLFRNAAQLHRLLPDVIRLLADMGLRVNFAKSCVVSRLPLTLSGA